MIEPTQPGAEQEGITVRQVLPNSAAARAGLKVGDVITRIDNQEVDGPESFIKTVARHKPGEKLTLHIRRGEQERDVQVTLRELQPGRDREPGERSGARSEENPNEAAGTSRQGKRIARLGAAVIPAGELTPQMRTQRGISTEEGLVVLQVTPNSPGARAGLRTGDVITRLDNQEIHDAESLTEALARHRVGDRLTLSALRGGEEQSLTVVLGARRPARASEQGANAQENPTQPSRERISRYSRERQAAYLGVQTVPTKELTDRLKKRLGITAEEGLVVIQVDPDSPAARAGVRHGDVITSVDGKKMDYQRDLRECISETGAGKQLTMDVLRGNQEQELHAQLEEPQEEVIVFVPMAASALPGPTGSAANGMPATTPEDQRKYDTLLRQIQRLERRVRELEQGRKQPTD